MSNKSNKQKRSNRANAADRDDAFSVRAWLAEGASGVLTEMKRRDIGLSQEFWTHSHNARREGLLAARAVLNQVIARGERCSTQEANRQQRQEQRGNISIG